MKRIIVWLGTVLPGLSAAFPALAQRYDQGPGFWHPGWGWGHMLFGGLMMIVFWGGIIAVIVLLVRWLGGTAVPPPSRHAVRPRWRSSRSAMHGAR